MRGMESLVCFRKHLAWGQLPPTGRGREEWALLRPSTLSHLRVAAGKGYRQVIIYLEAKVREFVEEFVIRIGKVLNRPSPKVNVRSTGYYYVEVKSRTLYELLKKLIDLDKIRKFVEHCEKCSRSVS
jgi:hypothetical protein